MTSLAALAVVIRALAPTISEYEARAVAEGLLREFSLVPVSKAAAPGGP